MTKEYWYEKTKCPKCGKKTYSEGFCDSCHYDAGD